MTARARAVISDFGGVLTTPLERSFAAVHEDSGIPLEALGRAMGVVAERDGEHPLFALEKGELSEADFLARIEAALREDLGRDVSLDGFAEGYFGHLDPNEDLFAYYRELGGRGVRLAMLTNNVREWEPRWRAMLPIDDIFELVVDSAFVGMRKPDPEIYELTLERLGLPAPTCVFVDDIEVNCQAAEALGIRAVWFRDTAQAIADIERALAG